MNPIFDMSDEGALSTKDIAEVRTQATEFLRRRSRNALYATVAFVLSCFTVMLFLAGFPLHSYWESLGRFFLLLTMGLLPVFLYYVSSLWSAWAYRRDIEKEFK